MRKYIFIIIAIILGLSSTNATPIEQWYLQGNDFYSKEQFDSAITYYNRVISYGTKNSVIYYNLANSYYRIHKIGLAMLYYEKALQLNPTDPDIIANIKFLKKQMVDKVPEPQRSFIESILWHLHTIATLNSQLWIMLFLLFMIAAIFSLWLYVSNNTKLWLVYLGSLCLLLALVLGLSIGIKIYSTEKLKYAIVLEQTVDAKNKPDGSRVLFTVHEGTKFKIIRSNKDWFLVSLPNGVSGWVKKTSIEKI